MSLTITSAPAVEPVSLSLVKEFLRIDDADTSQDNVLALQITSAREEVEEYLRRSLITRTYSWEVDADDIRGKTFLPRPNIQSITSITTYDESGGSETSAVVDASNYQLIEGLYFVSRNDGITITINRFDRAATIVYVAGYGDAATDVPSKIREAILKLIATNFEVREEAHVGTAVGKVADDWRKGIKSYIYNGK